MANYGLPLVEYFSTYSKIKIVYHKLSKTWLYMTSCLFVEKMFLLQNLCCTDRFILGLDFTYRDQVPGHVENSTTRPPQSVCQPGVPSMVLRTSSWFCSGFSSSPHLRVCPQASANRSSREASLYSLLHLWPTHLMTPKSKPVPQTPLTSIWPTPFKYSIGPQSSHENPVLSLKCGPHVP